MRSNVGMGDRVTRMFAGVSLAMFFVFRNSAWAFIGLIPFITGVVGYCPLYALSGIHTGEKSSTI